RLLRRRLPYAPGGRTSCVLGDRCHHGLGRAGEGLRRLSWAGPARWPGVGTYPKFRLRRAALARSPCPPAIGPAKLRILGRNREDVPAVEIDHGAAIED